MKKIFNKLKYRFLSIIFNRSKNRKNKYDFEIKLESINKSEFNRNYLHKYFHHYFWNLSPVWLKEHRTYFSKKQRAFGEDAFHAMWYFIFKEFKPKKVLEIGVYRGSTLSLFSLLSQKFNLNTEVHGISPFSPAGDSVSKYLAELDYYEDVNKNFSFFNLPTQILHKGFSTDEAMIEVIKANDWDLIFIDGNHDYEVVKQDFAICSKQLNTGGLIVFDDASLYTDYKPPFYSSAGHPGPSKVAIEIDLNIFEEILSVGHNRIFKKL